MVGKTLKQYRVQGVLGRGGMGQVYTALDTRLQRQVAIKVLPAEFTADPKRKQRMVREARAAGAISHPAIAQIYDVDEVDGVTFIAMERVEGQTLRQLIIRRELDLLGAIEIAIQVCDGLAKAHATGIVHRDIKAENVMVTPEGYAKILDFGLAKLLDAVQQGEPQDPAGLHPSVVETVTKTMDGAVLGTIAYMSPEQARGRGIDHRSDIFSMGILLYEMVTGQLPFRGDSPLDTMHAIAYEETRPVTALRADLPPSVQQIVARALRKRPEDRYQEIAPMAQDLRAVRREIETGISRPVPLAERVRDGMRSFRELTPGEWAMPLGIAAVVVLLIYLVVSSGQDTLPGMVFLALIGLIVYRRIRNRRRRLIKRFCSRVKKMPEVCLVAHHGDVVTVVVDRASPKSSVRIHALMERANEKMFFGDPLSVVVRADVPADELRGLLEGPGILYIRENA